MRRRRRTCWTWWWSRLSRSDCERVRPPRGWLLFEAAGGWAGRWGWAGDGKSRSCGPRFAPSMALNAPAHPHRPAPLTGSGGRHRVEKNEKAEARWPGRVDPWSTRTTLGSLVERALGHGRHGPVEGGAGWVGGGVERHGWRESRPAWMRLLPSPANLPRPANATALQLSTLTLPLTAKDSTCRCHAAWLRPGRAPAWHDARHRR